MPPTVHLLDGGMSSALGELGVELDHPLWTARAVLDDPAAIVAAHRAFVRAGADIVTTAAYQLSRAGFEAIGRRGDDADAALARTTGLAREASRGAGRRVRVAASVGPYGAVLADGSEYTGRYGIDHDDLVRFHAERLAVLCASGPDLLACETLPGPFEAHALAEALARVAASAPGRSTPPCWVAFACRSAAETATGDPIEEAIAAATRVPGVVAVGVNCTAPSLVTGLLRRAAAVTSLPLVAYPNSGQAWDSGAKRWMGEPWAIAGELAGWLAAGARYVGGCCGVGPDAIAGLRTRLTRRPV